jgi:pimeloyl-ACP methyl ester carboxylesterase
MPLNNLFSLIATITSFLLFSITPSLAVDSNYVRRTSQTDTVIVFVHGVLGDAQTTWKNGAAYWPTMLTADPTFNGTDIFVYSYPTGLWAALSPEELALNMRDQLAANEVTNYHRIIFISHSMGGLVTRAYLINNKDSAARTVFAYFFSTPTSGSEVASLATLISQNPQFSKMKPMQADNYLGELLDRWLAADVKFPSYCGYEKLTTFGLMIVGFPSATQMCTRPPSPINTDHINIVKPASAGADSYAAFKAAYLRETAFFQPSAQIIQQLQAVLNLLHGQQMANNEYLFPELETYIKSPTEQNWRIVQSTARTLIQKINNAVEAAINFDAQFYDEGQKIVLAANGTMVTVDKSYNQPFTVARSEWNGKAFILRQVTELQNRPTPEQAKKWEADLKGHYQALDVEMKRLLAMVQQQR